MTGARRPATLGEGSPPSSVGVSRREILSGLFTTGLAAAILSDTRSLADAAKIEEAPVDHGQWSALLGAYLVESPNGINRLRYEVMKGEASADLHQYLSTLQQVRVSGLPRKERFAFWCNLYNATTVRVVPDHYPVRSIRDINLGGGFFARGPWKKKLVRVEGRPLSLDDIEHEILRKEFKDKRVHYALNCASLGCPNLQARAFSGAELESALNYATGAYINHPRGINVQNDGVVASKIYGWFKEDFGANASLFRHWLDYAAPGLASVLGQEDSVAAYEYDWGLNDAG